MNLNENTGLFVRKTKLTKNLLILQNFKNALAKPWGDTSVKFTYRLIGSVFLSPIAETKYRFRRNDYSLYTYIIGFPFAVDECDRREYGTKAS